MPQRSIIVRMATRGAELAARQVENVKDEVQQLARAARRGSGSFGVFGAAVQFAAVRLTVFAGIATLALGALVALSPVLALAIGALTAAFVALLPIVALGVGIVQRFQDTAGIAGSAANELKKALDGLQHVWNQVISPAAAIVMRALADAIKAVTPALATLERPMAFFATYMAQAIRDMTPMIIELMPRFTRFLYELAPLLPKLAEMTMAWVSAILTIATYGIPAFEWLIVALTDVAQWLEVAAGDMDAFIRSAQFASTVGGIFSAVAGTVKLLGGMFSELWTLIKNVAGDLGPMASFLISVFKTAIEAVTGSLGFLNDNFEWLRFILVPLGAGLMAAAAAAIVMSIATGILNAILAVNPIVWVVAALAALAYGLYYAYTQSETLRGVVQAVWNAMIGFAGWVSSVFTTVWDAVIAKIEQIIDLFQRAIEIASTAADVLTPGGKHGIGSDDGLLGIPGVPFLASGGTISRGGAAVVGERGPELVTLPTGSTVWPNGTGPQAPAGDVVVHSTLVMPNGEVLARSVERVGRQRKATR